MPQKNDFAADFDRHSSFLEFLWTSVCDNITIPNVKALMKQHGQLLNLSEAEAVIALPPTLLMFHRRGIDGKEIEHHIEVAFEKFFKDSCNCDERIKVLLVAYKAVK